MAIGRPALTLLAVSMPLLLAASEVLAGGVEFRAGNSFQVGVTSLKERRFQGVVEQQHDFSCGSAAVATLLTHHYERDTPESTVFDAMWEVGDQDKIRAVGFSLLDMKNYLTSQGYRADGFRIPLERLERVRVPAIALIDTRGYKHFVVVTGMERGRVLVADPALGLRAMRLDDFEKSWNGVLFMIRDQVEVARARFNDDRSWDAQPDAPLGAALSTATLASFTMHLPGRGDL